MTISGLQPWRRQNQNVAASINAGVNANNNLVKHLNSLGALAQDIHQGQVDDATGAAIAGLRQYGSSKELADVSNPTNSLVDQGIFNRAIDARTKELTTNEIVTADTQAREMFRGIQLGLQSQRNQTAADTLKFKREQTELENQGADATGGLQAAILNAKSVDEVNKLTSNEVYNRLTGKNQSQVSATANSVRQQLKTKSAASATTAYDLEQKKISDTKTKQAGIDTLQEQYGVIQGLLKHPGASDATGWQSNLFTLGGTDASDYETQLDRIKGGAFLEAFERLKGGGQITETEGQKATDAIANLNLKQSDAQHEKSLKAYQDVLLRGMRRAGVDIKGLQAGGNAPASALQFLSQNPSAIAQFQAKYGYLPEGY